LQKPKRKDSDLSFEDDYSERDEEIVRMSVVHRHKLFTEI